MWFCAALLMFSVVYGLVRLTGWMEPRIELGGNGRASLAIAGLIAAMAASTFLVRIAVTEDASVLNMHPGDFPQYVLMFAAGAFGYRGGWITGLPERLCLRWASATLALAVPLFAALLLLAAPCRGRRRPMRAASMR
jgi:glucans biosynthesis protein C